MSTATPHRIRAGEVFKSIIPAAGLRLKVSHLEDYRYQSVALGGTEHAEWSAYTLEQVTEIAERLTAWATWYAAPGFEKQLGQEWIHACGRAYPIQGAAWLLTDQTPTRAIHYAFHEALHVAENWLSLAEMQTLNAGIVAGPDLPEVDWNTYYKTAIEIRAEAFANWAYSYWLRGRMPQYHRGMAADERIWTMIYRGDLGLRIARRGLIPADRMPEALRRRLAERGDGQKLIDAVRPVAAATWRGLAAAVDWVIDAFRPDVAPMVKGRATK
jgi:hypothetical protein